MARLDDRMGEIMAEIADLEDQQDEQDAREYHAQNPGHLEKWYRLCHFASLTF